MNDKEFIPPDEVNTPWGHPCPIRSDWEALEYLEGPWSAEHRGRRHRAAARTCRDALDGLRPASAARKAFAQIAREIKPLAATARRSGAMPLGNLKLPRSASPSPMVQKPTRS